MPILSRLAAVLLALVVIAGGTRAWAYPPKEADWVALSANSERIIATWRAMNFVDTVNASPDDLAGLQAHMKDHMGEVNDACAVMRDQIGTGGLFGPDMWTQGFRQTCWAIASFQKSGERTFAAKVCGDTKDALNYFRAFKPKRWPAAYPLAEQHVAEFIRINDIMRQFMRVQGVKACA